MNDGNKDMAGGSAKAEEESERLKDSTNVRDYGQGDREQ